MLLKEHLTELGSKNADEWCVAAIHNLLPWFCVLSVGGSLVKELALKDGE